MDKTDITAGQLADELKVSRPTMEKRVRRTFPDLSPALSSPLSTEQIARLSAGRTGKVRRTKRQNPGVTSEPARANELAPIAPAKSGLSLDKIRAVAFDAVCISAVVGHAGLIWYDCAVMWETPGIIGGGMAFLFAIAGLLIATDPAKPRTSGAALWFMFLVDCAAWFVHYPTFLMSANIGEIETGALCGFICLLSFAALYLYQDSKID